MEHRAHIRNGASVPCSERLIEGRGIIEHIAHIRHGAGIEVREGLIESRGT